MQSSFKEDLKLSTEDVAWLTHIPEETLRLGVVRNVFSFGRVLMRDGLTRIEWRTGTVLDYVIDNETLNYKNEELKPCIECKDRHLGCQSTCDAYRHSILIKAVRDRQTSRFDQLSTTCFGSENKRRGGRYASISEGITSDNNLEV